MAHRSKRGGQAVDVDEKKELNRSTPTRSKQSAQEEAATTQLHRFRVLEVRIHSPPAMSQERTVVGGRRDRSVTSRQMHSARPAGRELAVPAAVASLCNGVI